MHADKHKTHLRAHNHWQGPGAHTRPEGITGVGLAVAALGHVMGAHHTYHTCKSFHKLRFRIGFKKNQFFPMVLQKMTDCSDYCPFK